jgi:hypothetical protein
MVLLQIKKADTNAAVNAFFEIALNAKSSIEKSMEK